VKEPAPAAAVRIAGETHVGKVRTTNEDSMIVDGARGLYAVLDGMGGANAGDIASQTARDALRDFVVQKRLHMEPRLLLEAGIQAACAAVWNAAQRDRTRHGMGTTVVACLLVDNKRAIIAHVGDSRAYLLRGGRLQVLTRDHTVVEELVARGLLAAEAADRHPYKNVLSRNLGAKPEARIDVTELELQPGDRLLLCSDGLYGYASAEGIQYLLGSGDAPEQVARDLIDLALRGGGGDNVSTIVVEAPPTASAMTLVRTSGAAAWWHHRKRFVRAADERGLAANPICRGLAPNEALDLVALSLCEAIYHDLEKSTGVNVWTFAQNLAGGWFERRGEWSALRGLMDILAVSARTVVHEVRASDVHVGYLLDLAVSRALVVAELAIGGLLADRLRSVDENLIKLHGAIQDNLDTEVSAMAIEAGAVTSASRDAIAPRDSSPKFADSPTVPFLHPDRPVSNAGISAELVTAIGKTLTIARARTAPRADLVRTILSALETIACDGSGNFGAAVIAARELYGVRTVDEAGILPLFDALDQARIICAASVHQISASEGLRAKALQVISSSHQRLVAATAGLVLEAVAPFSERLREVQVQTGQLRDQVAKAEHKRAALESKFAASVDHTQPWETRGSTEW
jgi:protein phosphatase